MNMETKKKTRGSFTGNLGFVLAAAGSAVGLGNLWRFPYIAAKDGGGLFVLLYIILALTFGFTLLTTEIAIGRKTQNGPLSAYSVLLGKKKGGVLGWIATIIPFIILPYYCVIGGWVVRYGVEYVSGATGLAQTEAGTFFTSFVTSIWMPIVCFLVYMGITAAIILLGVDKGIEKISKIIMPALIVLILAIAVYAMTLSYTDEDGITRTAIQGLGVYLIPDFSKITLSSFLTTLLDAAGQMFYSLSIAMGIMITYGSYSPKSSNIVKSVNQIEIFDSFVAIIAGIIIIPSVYVFQGAEGLSKSGPQLMFVSMPQVFSKMGVAGIIVGAAFFLLVFFAAVTSSVSLMEAIVSSLTDRFHLKRRPTVIFTLCFSIVIGVIVCLGYNVLYFEADFITIKGGQILDILDYISNNLMMPVLALLTCFLFGWSLKPDPLIDEVKIGMEGRFKRERLFRVMLRYICPVILIVILLQALGVFG